MTTFLVSLGLVVVFVGIWLAYIKWGSKNPAVIGKAFDMAAMLSAVVSSLIKNNDLKTDPHDVLVAISKLATTGSMIVRQASSGYDLRDAKVQMKQFVVDVTSQFPEIKNKVDENMIDKEIDAALLALNMINKK